MKLDFSKPFGDEELEYLKSLPQDKLKAALAECNDYVMICDTNQINRKLLINSLYGALGNIYFRFYDLRNASAITLFGQLAIQWIERKVNEYLNVVCKTNNVAYVIAGDTDSIYVCVDNVVALIPEGTFKTTDEKVTFLSRFGKEKMEPAIDKAYRELCEYMNNREHLMFMDREAISCPPLNSKGIGGFWKAKKRYALCVWDMEEVRFKTPKLKIMGMETQQTSTPKAVQDALEESIRLMLQEGEEALQEHYKKFEAEYRELDYKVIAQVKTANNVQKYNDGKGFPASKCPYHVRGVLTYNRATDGYDGILPIMEGEKVMVLPLKEGNIFQDKCIAWPSGTELPKEIRDDVLASIDYGELFVKSFADPLAGMCEASGLNYEHKADLADLFSF